MNKEEFDKLVYPKYLERKHKTLASLSRGKVLDIGFAQDPNRFLKNAYGVDIQKVKLPKNYLHMDVINLNYQDLPFSNNTFDTVVIADTIEHVENPSYLLREINRVLKKGGRLALSTPHANYWWNIFRDYFLSFIPWDGPGEHLSNWGILDFKKLLNKNGFEVNKLIGTFMTIPLLRWTIPVKRLPKLGWIIIYSCTKIGKANKNIFTHNAIRKMETIREYDMIEIKQEEMR